MRTISENINVRSQHASILDKVSLPNERKPYHPNFFLPRSALAKYMSAKRKQLYNE